MATLTAPDAVAMDSQKLEQVKILFQKQISDGDHPGAGLAVYRYGNLVLLALIGLAILGVPVLEGVWRVSDALLPMVALAW